MFLFKLVMEKIMLKIAFDIDGVVADFMRAIRSWITYNYSIADEAIPYDRYDLFTALGLDIAGNPAREKLAFMDVYNNYPINAIWNNLNFIKSLATANNEDVCFITNRDSDAHEATVSWLTSKLGTDVRFNVVHVARHMEKLSIIRSLGLTMFVEDVLPIAKHIANGGIYTILVDRAYNQGNCAPANRISSLESLMPVQEDYPAIRGLTMGVSSRPSGSSISAYRNSLNRAYTSTREVFMPIQSYGNASYSIEPIAVREDAQTNGDAEIARMRLEEASQIAMEEYAQASEELSAMARIRNR
jgi:uncharacterized HAD superfamily protein